MACKSPVKKCTPAKVLNVNSFHMLSTPDFSVAKIATLCAPFAASLVGRDERTQRHVHDANLLPNERMLHAAK